MKANSPEKPKGGTKPMSKQAIYSKIASHAEDIINKLLEDTNSNVPSVRVSALKTLINKIVPDLKSHDVDFGDSAVKILLDFSDRSTVQPTSKLSAEATDGISNPAK
jgi:hypothetical protein